MHDALRALLRRCVPEALHFDAALQLHVCGFAHITPFLLRDGDSPLHRAASADHLEVARFLVGAGADVNARNK